MRKIHQTTPDGAYRRPSYIPQNRLEKVFLTPEQEKLFWSNVDTSSECWNWIGKTKTYFRHGYKYTVGRFHYERIPHLAHRIAYAVLHNGEIPPFHDIIQSCRNHLCMKHLEAVSPKIRNFRSNSISSNESKKTHCCRGHALMGSNLIPANLRQGYRACAICHLNRRLERNKGESK